MKWVLILLLLVACTSNPIPEVIPINENYIPQSGPCNVEFTEYFVNPDYVESMGEVGVVHGSGKFIVGRSYVSLHDNLTKIPIYAPTNMVLFKGSHYLDTISSQDEGYLPDYALFFDARCGVTVMLAHLKEVVDSIDLPEVKKSSAEINLDPVEFEVGDLIGYFIQNAGVAGFDIMVFDDKVTNKFARKEVEETNLLHVVCPYDYYKDNAYSME